MYVYIEFFHLQTKSRFPNSLLHLNVLSWCVQKHLDNVIGRETFALPTWVQVVGACVYQLNRMGGGDVRLLWERVGGSVRAYLHNSWGGPKAKSGSPLSEGSLGEGL